MRKLLLLQPPSLTRVHRGLYNLAALATYVEGFCEVRVHDSTDAALETCLIDFQPHIVGITSYTVTYGESIEQMRIVKDVLPQAIRLIGGSHISCLPESLDPVFDAGVVGDGEETLKEIIERGSRDTLGSIRGLCCRKDERVILNPRPPVDPGTLPVPKLHVYAPHVYQSGCVGFITSRGCPFHCAFCYNPAMQNRLRNYPVAWVADQFEYAMKVLGAGYLMMLDDTVSLSAERLSAIRAELDRRRLGSFQAAVNIRSSTVNDGLCQALKDLNVVSWNCGFESGSDRVLKRIKGRSASVAKHYELVCQADRYNVALNGSFMFGAPGETASDMESTLSFMEYLSAEKKAGRYRGGFWSFCATPLPGTAWWQTALSHGKVGIPMDWSKLDIKSFDHHLLLDASVSDKAWRGIVERAAAVAREANSYAWSPG
ncbi:Fe-S oxidoreductase [Dehalogenimonas alkenigignens]|uniref:Fe-S oxidoreductase n=1 Tax=Dehalogenimonas alkenigignens TaxID=1217799 RepID=A0A0W0GKD4_9CHLR|nr:radical SAM protein [Dehalogenimonas alkenigignens]KTB49029.1 Fe-S oxidoreductase [Dehalogenimonas alkenigignens]